MYNYIQLIVQPYYQLFSHKTEYCKIQKPQVLLMFGDSIVDLMEAGTTEQCLNAQEGAIEGENNGEKRKPPAHSPQDTHFLSVSLTQHPGGRGG